MRATPAQVGETLTRLRWLRFGGPLTCGNCARAIHPGAPGSWTVCRGWAEHVACHLPDPGEEDVERAITIDEAELQAYRDARARTGPSFGDHVRLTYPDGSSVAGVWTYTADPCGRAAPALLLPDGQLHRHVAGHVRRDVLLLASEDTWLDYEPLAASDPHITDTTHMIGRNAS